MYIHWLKIFTLKGLGSMKLKSNLKHGDFKKVAETFTVLQFTDVILFARRGRWTNEGAKS